MPERIEQKMNASTAENVVQWLSLDLNALRRELRSTGAGECAICRIAKRDVLPFPSEIRTTPQDRQCDR